MIGTEKLASVHRLASVSSSGRISTCEGISPLVREYLLVEFGILKLVLQCVFLHTLTGD
jgi:hypothetical protein